MDRTTERDEQLLGLIAPGAKCRPMDIFGVVQSRLLKVPLRRRHLIPCVLHLLIFVGRQVTALVRTLATSVRPSTRVSVQAILHRSGCHIALRGTAEPNWEETWCLLKVWEDLASLLGGDMRMHTAVVAMYILLGDMYGTMFEEGALQAPEVAQAFQRWVCPEIRSPYINWMLHDATVTIQAIRPYGLGIFSGDLLEGSNRVLKDIWSSFCDRGGGAGSLVTRRSKMLRQVNEHLILGCSVLGGGAEPHQFWVLLIWLEPGISHVTWVQYDATMCLPCFVCSILPVLHFLQFDLCVL